MPVPRARAHSLPSHSGTDAHIQPSHPHASPTHSSHTLACILKSPYTLHSSTPHTGTLTFVHTADSDAPHMYANTQHTHTFMPMLEHTHTHTQNFHGSISKRAAPQDCFGYKGLWPRGSGLTVTARGGRGAGGLTRTGLALRGWERPTLSTGWDPGPGLTHSTAILREASDLNFY